VFTGNRVSCCNDHTFPSQSRPLLPDSNFLKV
jgi:hypothetical protein